ncbi:MAG: electron transfer flavoprotein subunit beta/FixA family protein [Spirochaetota bacterium]
MLRIAVCIKQVPAYDEGTMDPETGLLQRGGLEAVMNPYDLPAVESALQLRERYGGTVDVFTMGPEKAREVIIQAYSMGVDNGYLLADQAFAGADVLATSYTLYQGINAAGQYDLIICGRQTTDGDTAQVGGALARWQDIPHANWITSIHEVGKDYLIVSQAFEHERARIKLPFPCLIAVEREICTPRMPTLTLRLQAKKKSITHLRVSDLADSHKEHYGQKGSPTQVERIYPAKTPGKETVVQTDPGLAVEEILNLVRPRDGETHG